MKILAALAAFAVFGVAQTAREPLHAVTAVRHWSRPEVTRIAVEVTGDFVFRTDYLHSPERVYYDILNSRPRLGGRRYYSEDLNDRLLKRIRVAETAPGVTRVVLDVVDGVETHASQLVNPNRLIVELRPGSTPSMPPLPDVSTPPTRAPKLSPPPSIRPAPITTDAVERMIAQPSLRPPAPLHAPEVERASLLRPSEPASALAHPVERASLLRPSEPAPALAPVSHPVESSAARPLPEPLEKSVLPPSIPGAPRAARHTSAGDTSLVRALGLKIQRVVIDPGHGGHDQGTEGPHGLLEKDLVLDVSLRLGKLIQDRLGAEVIYTRTDDTFIPLEGRTELANEKKADLFLSIHANSSPVPRITGVETYYLSLTDSKEAKDLASRENDSSQMSLFELRDLVQKIALNDKMEESKEFASRVQASLFAFSAHSFPAEKNRGVKKAPFVVLIGAQMPSILAEIGFVTNGREEALLRKPEYRQKLAEALYRGVSRYADSLSHFQVAQNSK